MSTLDDLLVASGKVREIYDMGDDTLLLVASDRISAFDVILPTPIPDKGRVLTGMTRFWLDRTQHIVANHMLGTAPDELPELARTPELAGRSMHVKKLEMLPLECVVRGYLVGSGWKDYQRTGTVCGHRAADGPRAGRAPAAAAVHAVHQGRAGRARREHHRDAGHRARRRPAVPRAGARLDRAVRGRGQARARRAASSSPTRSSSSGSTPPARWCWPTRC